MSPTRRDFLKYTGAASLLLASSDLVGELIAQSPKGNPLTSSFKGLADLALAEAKQAGCSYADVRFTRSVSSGVNANGGSDRNTDGGVGGFGGGRGGRRRRPRRRRARRRPAGRGRLRGPRHSQRRLGVREQPDRHRGRNPADRARRRRRRQSERGRQEGRRQAGAGCRLYRVLVDADAEGPGLGVAGRQAGVRPESGRRRREEQGRRRT